MYTSLSNIFALFSLIFLIIISFLFVDLLKHILPHYNEKHRILTFISLLSNLQFFATILIVFLFIYKRFIKLVNIKFVYFDVIWVKYLYNFFRKLATIYACYLEKIISSFIKTIQNFHKKYINSNFSPILSISSIKSLIFSFFILFIFLIYLYILY